MVVEKKNATGENEATEWMNMWLRNRSMEGSPLSKMLRNPYALSVAPIMGQRIATRSSWSGTKVEIQSQTERQKALLNEDAWLLPFFVMQLMDILVAAKSASNGGSASSFTWDHNYRSAIETVRSFARLYLLAHSVIDMARSAVTLLRYSSSLLVGHGRSGRALNCDDSTNNPESVLQPLSLFRWSIVHEWKAVVGK